ncbi:MAG: DUF4253 domain-containing protein [Clostridiales Family XIII bacterium]|jgi:hypothetical protein|nr:DUF4253 domain-containing protein [Clostridiales Family XIII bacterium]
MTQDCQTIIDFLGCDYELFENEPDGAKICIRHEELWEQGLREGFTPLLILVSDVLAEAMELSFEDADLEADAENAAALREDILQKAEAVDTDAFLSARLLEYTEMHEGDDITGEFEDQEPVNFLLSINAKNDIPEIILAKIPTANPWELPAWIPMGGFNDCPSPAEQVAVFRSWHERCGAVPDLVSYDVWEMELRGKEPVTDNAGAEALAKEQFAFCYDLVMQAFGQAFCGIRGLASRLKGSSTWYFWWD